MKKAFYFLSFLTVVGIILAILLIAQKPKTSVPTVEKVNSGVGLQGKG